MTTSIQDKTKFAQEQIENLHKTNATFCEGVGFVTDVKVGYLKEAFAQ